MTQTTQQSNAQPQSEDPHPGTVAPDPPHPVGIQPYTKPVTGREPKHSGHPL